MALKREKENKKKGRYWSSIGMCILSHNVPPLVTLLQKLSRTGLMSLVHSI